MDDLFWDIIEEEFGIFNEFNEYVNEITEEEN